VEVKLIAW